MNDIDRLMSLTPPLCAQDIDEVIAYHREQRRRRAAGEKPQKQTVDLGQVLKLKPAQVVKVERRI